jgi:hypothetical protein
MKRVLDGQPAEDASKVEALKALSCSIKNGIVVK